MRDASQMSFFQMLEVAQPILNYKQELDGCFVAFNMVGEMLVNTVVPVFLVPSCNVHEMGSHGRGGTSSFSAVWRECLLADFRS